MQAYPFLNEGIVPSPSLGVVVTAVEGKARRISVAGKLLIVYAQASHLPFLNCSDEVLFLETEKGPYLIARNLRPDEFPQLAWQQQYDKLRLQFGNAQIIISADGEIMIANAKSHVTLQSNGEVILNGKHLHLNSEK